MDPVRLDRAEDRVLAEEVPHKAQQRWELIEPLEHGRLVHQVVGLGGVRPVRRARQVPLGGEDPLQGRARFVTLGGCQQTFEDREALDVQRQDMLLEGIIHLEALQGVDRLAVEGGGDGAVEERVFRYVHPGSELASQVGDQ